MASSPLQSVQISDGDNFIPLIYDELRVLAKFHMNGERSGQTLEATGLVHEAYLRLRDSNQSGLWNDREQFFRAASEAMRRILIDRARAKLSQKRGGEWVRDDFSEAIVAIPLEDEEILKVNDALSELEMVDAESAEIVKMHFFVGLDWKEIAEIMEKSSRTIRRNWAYARAWLLQRMEE